MLLSVNMFLKTIIISHAIYYKIIKYFKNTLAVRKINNTSIDTGFSLNKMFECLDIPANSNIYLYVGLKQLKKKTGLGYETLTKKICDILINDIKVNSILVPTNTFVFRKSKVFSVKYSPSEVGMFSELFRQYATFRTLDPIHNFSIWCKNSDFYEKLEYENSFSDKGLFGSTIADNYIALNIGTDEFKVHHIHYLEYQHKVPYLDFNRNFFKGIVFDSNNNPIEVNQENLTSKYIWKINFNKQTKALVKAKVLTKYSYKGININQVTITDYCKVFNKKLKNNPYFFTTF